ncbi:MAG: MYXO-CTERM sorting domain-containing protein [Myxococcota bacterium]
MRALPWLVVAATVAAWMPASAPVSAQNTPAFYGAGEAAFALAIEETFSNWGVFARIDGRVGERGVRVDDANVGFPNGTLVMVWQTQVLDRTAAAQAGRYFLTRIRGRRDYGFEFVNPWPDDWIMLPGAQLVRVNEFADVTIPQSATLEVKPWDPLTQTGGIIAFAVSGTLDLEGTIETSGAGFAGGAGTLPDRCDTGGSLENGGGVVASAMSVTGGVAPSHRGGGGGGANGGAGGDGRAVGFSDAMGPCTTLPRTSGGQVLPEFGQAPDRLFLGGGGGAGGEVTLEGGGSGGGAVFIRSLEIVPVDGTIAADGLPGGPRGGGGAGGTIVLETGSSCALSLSARGATSGSGGGGGGGGGRLFSGCRHAADGGNRTGPGSGPASGGPGLEVPLPPASAILGCDPDNDPCPLGSLCYVDACVAGCLDDLGCPGAELCNQEQFPDDDYGDCQLACTVDSMCAAGAEICVDGMCRAGCRVGSADCENGLECLPTGNAGEGSCGCISDRQCDGTEVCVDGSCEVPVSPNPGGPPIEPPNPPVEPPSAGGYSFSGGGCSVTAPPSPTVLLVLGLFLLRRRR